MILYYYLLNLKWKEFRLKSDRKKLKTKIKFVDIYGKDSSNMEFNIRV